MADPREFRDWLDWFAQRRDLAVEAPWADKVRYDLNASGYRCDEFDDPLGLRVFSIGCSCAFGTGIPYETTFSHRVAAMLGHELGVPATNWNLSSPGKSADYIARLVSSAVPLLRPDVVIVVFSYIGRREFITETGRLIGYSPNVPDWIVRDVMYPEALDVYRAFDRLVSRPNDLRNLVVNFRLCEDTVRRADIPWCYSTMEPDASEDLSRLGEGSDHIGACMVPHDAALDGAHPGPESNRIFAEAIVDHLRRSGKLGVISARVRTRQSAGPNG
jgi:hypothetical protein